MELKKVARGFNKDLPCPELNDLVNSKILDIGFPEKIIEKHQEGGLTIIYETPEGKKKQIVFGYTELGLWIYENREK